MFGELDDSDIYENNPSGGFDSNSDTNDTSSGISDDFLDMSSYEDPSLDSLDYNAGSADESGGVLGSDAFNIPPQQNVPQDDAVQEVFEEGPVREQAPKKNSGLVFILLLAIVFVAAAGMFFYQKNMAQTDAPPQDQAMGDYFYDKANEDGAVQAPSQAAPQDAAGTATIDVDLASSQSQAVAPQAEEAVKADPEKARLEQMAKDGKEMNAIEKAMLKKKMDEAKESQVSLSARPVIIPVSAGGRVDPFMPYAQREALANKPKFDIIAPPMELPAADPVVDEVIDTKISGIMYDSARPSAIVNFGGTDQLVHKGDTVKGCKILDITKNTVVIKYKTNIYQASVGQSLNEGVNLNPVSNLAKQFGGAYSDTPKSTIQFNK